MFAVIDRLDCRLADIPGRREVRLPDTKRHDVLTLALQFADFNMISSIGAFIAGASFLLFLYIMWRTLTAGQKVENPNYWGDQYPALEWSLPNPPPAHTFETLPTREEWDKQQPAHH